MRVSYPQAVLGALGVVVLVAVLVAASTSSAAFGVYNPAWDGAGQLRDVASDGGANATVITNTSRYESTQPARTTAVVLSPSEPYGASTARLRQFVTAGGTLVVAEDFGSGGNEVLHGVNATARFDGRLVRDERHHDRGPALPVATNVTGAPGTERYTADVDSVTLNYGTVIRPNGATVAIGTSEFAYVDADRNGSVDDAEPIRSFPVVTVERVGAGRVVAVSDPSLFINAMLERPGNRQFAANLLATERVLLDYSHAGSQPPLTLGLLAVRGSPVLQGGLVVLGVGAVVGASLLVGRRGGESEPPSVDRDTLADHLARERGWDASRVSRLTTTVWGRPEEDDDNE